MIQVEFQDEKFELFNSANGLFGTNYTPILIDIQQENDTTFGSILHQSALYYSIIELKEILGIDSDVILSIPQLKLELHQDLDIVKKLTPFDLENFYSHLEDYQKSSKVAVGESGLGNGLNGELHKEESLAIKSTDLDQKIRPKQLDQTSGLDESLVESIKMEPLRIKLIKVIRLL
jgi:hypothetical protein